MWFVQGREPLIAAVRQISPMIVRIFRVEIDPATRSAFEAGFQSLSVDAVTQSPGNLSCEIGMPTCWSPNTYAMTPLSNHAMQRTRDKIDTDGTFKAASR